MTVVTLRLDLRFHPTPSPREARRQVAAILEKLHRNFNVTVAAAAGDGPDSAVLLVAAAAATRKAAREKGNEIRRFMRAVTAGYQTVRRTPAAAVKALVAANHDLDPKLQLASVKVTPFFPAGGRPFGYQDPRLWAAYGDWMLRNQLLTRPPNAAMR